MDEDEAGEDEARRVALTDFHVVSLLEPPHMTAMLPEHAMEQVNEAAATLPVLNELPQ
jgi:hypothetical protein